MSSFLNLFSGTEEITVAPGFTVTIKQFLANEDYSLAQDALLPNKQFSTANTGASGGGIGSRVDTSAYNATLVLRAIKSWNLTDENDAVLPLNETSIKRLPQPVFEKVLNRINELNEQGGSPKEQADFRPENDGSVLNESATTTGVTSVL